MFEIDRSVPSEKINISKKYIESVLTQDEIFKYYLDNFPVEEWKDTRENFRSQLRVDKTPTCSLYTKNGNLYYKDWNGHFHGDCYNLVCFKNNLAYSDLMGAMKIIVRDFAHRFYGVSEVQNIYLKSLIEEVEQEQRRQKKIQITKQLWTHEQVQYWKAYGITSSFLADYQVYSAKYVFLEDKLHYTHSKSDFAIAYYFGEGRYKIYYPLRAKGRNRFMGNSTAIQGYNQLREKGDLLVITKSLKDVIILRMFDIDAIALQSEQHHFEERAYKHLSERFKKMVVLYDNDDAGRSGAKRIYEKYNIPSIEIPEDYTDCKDISDVAKNYSLDDAYECMENLLYNI